MRISRAGQETAAELVAAFELMVRTGAVAIACRDSLEFAGPQEVARAYKDAILEAAKNIQEGSP